MKLVIAGAIFAIFVVGCSTEKPAESENVDDPPRTQPKTASDELQSRAQDNEKSPVSFRTIGAENGFDFTRFDDISGRKRILEVNGGGVGVIDFDGDLWPDLFMTNGCRLPVQDDDHDTPSVLFRNGRNLQFEESNRESGLSQFGFATGCAVGDFNNDGFEDLLVTAYGPNTVWTNNGDGTFQKQKFENGHHRWSTSAMCFDFNRDSNLDLYIVNYLDESDTHPTLCPNDQSPTGYVGCPPSLMEAQPDTLLLNDGQGGFVDVSSTTGLDQLKGKGLGVAATDFDGDGQLEIFVANDGEANFLLKSVNKTGNVPSLVNVALESQVAFNEAGFAQASMGVGVADFDHSGSPDLFLTHFFSDTNTLYLNESERNTLLFVDATRGSRLGPPSRRSLGFGVGVFDVNNDGWQDLFVANGHVDDRSDAANPEPYRMTQQLFLNENGRFTDVSATSGNYFQRSFLGRGVATADLDRDMRVDVIVSHQLEPSVILHNESEFSAAATLLRKATGASETRIRMGNRLFGAEKAGGSFQSACDHDLQISRNALKAGLFLNDARGEQGVVEHSSWMFVHPLGGLHSVAF